MSILFSITNLLGFKTNNTFILIAMSIVMFISGYLLSKEFTKKKYIHGLIFGIITSILYLLLSLIFNKELTFNIKQMGFKHTGLFPEQAVNWDFMMDKIQNCDHEVKVLAIVVD